MLTFDNKELEIYEYTGEGYERTMNFQEWRVALANFGDSFDREKFCKIERHMLTDEVFVLLTGKATLIIGKDLKQVEMEPGKIYNVKAAIWHACWMSKDAKILIVENHNTSKDNTEYLAVDGSNL
jgi:mannose-6-phosphate isomerase-like protein (cupin superfamily)